VNVQIFIYFLPLPSLVIYGNQFLKGPSKLSPLFHSGTHPSTPNRIYQSAAGSNTKPLQSPFPTPFTIQLAALELQKYFSIIVFGVSNSAANAKSLLQRLQQKAWPECRRSGTQLGGVPPSFERGFRHAGVNDKFFSPFSKPKVLATLWRSN